MDYADFTSIITTLAGVMGSLFDALDSLVILTLQGVAISLLDVFVLALYLYAIVGFFNWMRNLGGSSDDDEPEYGPVRPKARNTKTGKVYWK